MHAFGFLAVAVYTVTAAALALPRPESVSIAIRVPALDFDAQHSDTKLADKRRSDSSETFQCTYDCSGLTGRSARGRKQRDGSEDGSAWDN